MLCLPLKHPLQRRLRPARILPAEDQGCGIIVGDASGELLGGLVHVRQGLWEALDGVEAGVLAHKLDGRLGSMVSASMAEEVSTWPSPSGPKAPVVEAASTSMPASPCEESVEPTSPSGPQGQRHPWLRR